jgi:hypothetical protein
VSAVDDLLTWWLSGPTGDLLASPAGAPVVAAGSLAAVYAGAGLGASYDRLAVSARHAAVTAALVVALLAPLPQAAPALHTFRTTNTPGGTR